MKIAVVGSRTVNIDNLEDYLPQGCTEIVSGGAKGADMSAVEYAKRNALKITEFLPQYERYGRGAPIVRNRQIVEYADIVYAFWDGKSKGTKFVIDYCKKTDKKCIVILIEK